MARLDLTLLGGFRAQLDDGQVVALPIRKGQALLAYLAIPLGQAHPRDKLAALLWGDMRTPQARAGLRQTLFVIRKALGEMLALPLEDETVALDPAAVTVDVREFERSVAQATPESLEMAVSLYQGDFLEGLSLDEPPFEEWLLAERLRLRELALEALARLLAHHRDSGALDRAVRAALRLVVLDPLQEPVHRTLMRLFAQLGRRGAALRQYQLCVAALQREVRAEPETETKALYQEILQQRVARPPASRPADDGRVGVAPGLPRPSAPAPPESPLVGREVELGQLRDALQGAWAGRGHLVALIGEAGVGKSRLAIELGVEAGRKGGRTLAGRSYESEQVLPFGPWIDALRAGRLAQDEEVLANVGQVWRAELARLLPEIAAAPSEVAAGDSAQLFEAIARLLERMAATQTVLLILEDLQWADEMSLRLLAFVGRRLSRSRVLAVVTAREEDLAASTALRHTLDELARGDHVVRLALPPLSREDTVALARTLVPAGDAAALEERLWRASEGNPFMVVETLRALRGGHAPEGTPGLPLPERVRTLITQRIERLSDRSRRLVAVAAVIGRPFDFVLLHRAADVSEDLAAEGVEELVRHRVLHGAGEALEFTHDRIRQVLYAEILLPLRALLHRRVADALETLGGGEFESQALALGAHYREGQVWPKAVRYLTLAGTQASLHYAHRDAAVCYEQALEGLARLPESRENQEQVLDLRFKLAHSLFQVGRFEGARDSFRQAEALGLALGDHRRLGQINAGMTYLLNAEGDFAAAAQTGLRAFSTATSLGDLAVQIWTGIALGRVHLATGDYRQAGERLRWVIEALRDVPVDERFGRGSLLPSVASRTWLAISLGRLGEYVEALAWGDEAVRIADAVKSPQERGWAGYALARVHLGRGDLDAAMPLLERAVPFFRDGRLPLHWPFVLAFLGHAHVMRDRPDEGLRLLEQALAEARSMNLLPGHPAILILAGLAHLAAGHLEDAERHAETALELTRRHGARGDEAWSLRVIGEIAMRREPPEYERAGDRFVEALGLAEQLGMAPLGAQCHLSLGALHRRAGRVVDARRELSHAVEMLRRMQMSYWLPIAEALLAPAAGRA